MNFLDFYCGTHIFYCISKIKNNFKDILILRVFFKLLNLYFFSVLRWKNFVREKSIAFGNILLILHCYDANQLSNEADSSVNPSTGDNSHEAIFEDTQNSKNASSSSTTKTTTSLKVSGTKIYSGNIITITLKDNNGKPLKGKKISLKVPSKGKVFTKTTDSNGKVKYTFYDVGSFKSYASFNGDDSFKSSKLNFTFKVLKSGTSLKISNKTVPRSTAVIVTLKNTRSNKTLSDKKVRFIVPYLKKTYVKYTNSKGQAKA